MRDRDKDKENQITDYAGSELNCTAKVDSPAQAVSLIDQLKAERARVSQRLNKRLWELDRNINLLQESNAEGILNEAQSVLYRSE